MTPAFHRHCERKRSNPESCKGSLDCFVAYAPRNDEPNSRPRRAADVDHVAVAGRGILVDEPGDQNASVERDDLTIQLAGGGAGRSDIVLAALGALETQFLRCRLVGQM